MSKSRRSLIRVHHLSAKCILCFATAGDTSAACAATIASPFGDTGAACDSTIASTIGDTGDACDSTIGDTVGDTGAITASASAECI